LKKYADKLLNKSCIFKEGKLRIKKYGNYSGRHSGAKAQRHKEKSLAANRENNFESCSIATTKP
jgi:hypothetical protein